MNEGTLRDLSVTDGSGRAMFRVAASEQGDLVLVDPNGPLGAGLRELEVEERVRLATIAPDRPALVVETNDGGYVVLIDQTIDLERHVPLSMDDAALLSEGTARAQFGRRDDDVFLLTPWADDDEVVTFDPDAEQFADVPLVRVSADGEIETVRGVVSPPLLGAVRTQLLRGELEAGEVTGVLSNPFGETSCVAVGAPLLPHEDVRRQAMLTTSGLLDETASLEEAAQRLRRVADAFEHAAQAGWQLSAEILDGVGFAERT